MGRGGLWASVRQFLFGVVAYDAFEYATRARWSLHYLVILAVLGDLVGVPTRSYYSLRLLPYVLPDLPRWKRWLLRQRDLTERMG
ncbi:MAG: hypothetical protein AB1816_03055 [Bacillota bacterium]